MNLSETGARFLGKKELIEKRKPRVTIVGRFRHKQVIDEVITYLEEQGIDVPAPRKGGVTGEVITGFRLLEGDNAATEEEALKLELGFIESMVNSDAVYHVNPAGSGGFSSCYELGVAAAHRIPIFAMEPLDWDEPDHPTFQGIIRMIRVVPKEEIPILARTTMKQNKRGTTVIERQGLNWTFRRVR